MEFETEKMHVKIREFEDAAKMAEWNKDQIKNELLERVDEIKELNRRINGMINMDREFDPAKDKKDALD